MRGRPPDRTRASISITAPTTTGRALGAYYAYQQLCGTLSLTPFDPAAHTALTAENFYGTHYSKAPHGMPCRILSPTMTLPNSLTIYNVTAAGQPTAGPDHRPVRHTDKLNVYDKYAMFLHGNNGLSRIEGTAPGAFWSSRTATPTALRPT